MTINTGLKHWISLDNHFKTLSFLILVEETLFSFDHGPKVGSNLLTIWRRCLRQGLKFEVFPPTNSDYVFAGCQSSVRLMSRRIGSRFSLIAKTPQTQSGVYLTRKIHMVEVGGWFFQEIIPLRGSILPD